MFLNYSHHPSAAWEKRQLSAARQYGEIVDLPFPNVSPHANTDEIIETAKAQVQQIALMHPDAVMCQGEMTMVYHVVRLLKEQHIPVLCACTERVSQEYTLENGEKEKRSRFRFVQFRAY